jgi:hypothetical protein
VWKVNQLVHLLGEINYKNDWRDPDNFLIKLAQALAVEDKSLSKLHVLKIIRSIKTNFFRVNRIDRKSYVSRILSDFKQNSFTRSKCLENFSRQANQEVYIMTNNIKIETGDITNIGGQVNIGQFEEVYTSLTNSGHFDIAKGLEKLVHAIDASEYLTPIQKREQIKLAEQIGQEITKPTPNGSLIKQVWQRMMNFLKSIPDIIKVVTAIAPLLEQYFK